MGQVGPRGWIWLRRNKVRWTRDWTNMQDVCLGAGLGFGCRYVERKLKQAHLAKFWGKMGRLGEEVECGVGGPVGQGQVGQVLVKA